MNRDLFLEIKEDLKNDSPWDVACAYGWSLRTIQRVKQARSFKHYRELCRH